MFTQPHISSVQDPTHPFDIIYQAAKTKDEKAITYVLKDVFIDLLKSGVWGPPVYLLAFEKDIDSVNFLKDKFNASILWIVNGFAQGGHFSLVASFLQSAVNTAQYDDMLRYVAGGYALGGHVSKANETLNLSKTPAQHFLCLEEMITGYTLRQENKEIIDTLLHQTKRSKRIHLLNRIAYAKALNGELGQVHQIVNLVRDKKNRVEMLAHIACGYARAGLSLEQSNILHLVTTAEEKNGIIEQTVFSQASRGSATLVDNSSTLTITPHQLQSYTLSKAKGYAEGGYLAKAQSILNLSPPELQADILDSIYRCYGTHNNIIEITRLLNTINCPQKYLVALKNIALGIGIENITSHLKEIIKLLKTAETRFSFLCLLARGYACVENLEYALDVLNWATDAIEIENILYNIACVYSESGFTDELDKLFKQINTKVYFNYFLNEMANNYLINGHFYKIQTILNLPLSQEDKDSFLKHVGLCCAKNNNVNDIKLVFSLATGHEMRLILAQIMGKAYIAQGEFASIAKILNCLASAKEHKSAAAFLALEYAMHGYPSLIFFNNIVGFKHSELASTLKNLVFGYARIGCFNEINQMIGMPFHPNIHYEMFHGMLTGYARGGYTEPLSNLIETLTIVDYYPAIASIAHGSLQRVVKEGDVAELPHGIALKALSMATPYNRSQLNKKLTEKQVAKTYELAKLIPQAKKISQLMQQNHLNYNQSLAWTQPEILFWILQCRSFVSKDKQKRTPLLPELVLMIASYLAPPMSGRDWEQLADKASLAINKCGYRLSFYKPIAKHCSSNQKTTDSQNAQHHL